jgi:hypothetical protein
MMAMTIDAAVSIIDTGRCGRFVAGSAIPDGLFEDKGVRRWLPDGHVWQRLPGGGGTLSRVGDPTGTAAAETKGGMGWKGGVVEVS